MAKPGKNIVQQDVKNNSKNINTFEIIIDTCNSGLRNFLILLEMIDTAIENSSSLTKVRVTSPVTIEAEKGNKIFKELIEDQIKKSLRKEYKDIGTTSKFFSEIKNRDDNIKLNFRETNVGRSVKMLYLLTFEKIFNQRAFKDHIDPDQAKLDIIKATKKAMKEAFSKDVRDKIKTTDFDKEFDNLMEISEAIGTQFNIIYKKQKDLIQDKYEDAQQKIDDRLRELRLHREGYSEEISKLKKALQKKEARKSPELRTYLEDQLEAVLEKQKDSQHNSEKYENEIKKLEKKSKKPKNGMKEEINKKKVSLLAHFSKEIFRNMGIESKYMFQEMFDNIKMHETIKQDGAFAGFTDDKGEDAVIEIMVKRGKGNKKHYFTMVLSNDGPAREKIDKLRDKYGREVYVISDYGLEIIAKELGIKDEIRKKLVAAGGKYSEKYSEGSMFTEHIPGLNKGKEEKYAKLIAKAIQEGIEKPVKKEEGRSV